MTQLAFLGTRLLGAGFAEATAGTAQRRGPEVPALPGSAARMDALIAAGRGSKGTGVLVIDAA